MAERKARVERNTLETQITALSYSCTVNLLTLRYPLLYSRNKTPATSLPTGKGTQP